MARPRTGPSALFPPCGRRRCTSPWRRVTRRSASTQCGCACCTQSPLLGARAACGACVPDINPTRQSRDAKRGGASWSSAAWPRESSSAALCVVRKLRQVLDLGARAQGAAGRRQARPQRRRQGRRRRRPQHHQRPGGWGVGARLGARRMQCQPCTRRGGARLALIASGDCSWRPNQRRARPPLSPPAGDLRPVPGAAHPRRRAGRGGARRKARGGGGAGGGTRGGQGAGGDEAGGGGAGCGGRARRAVLMAPAHAGDQAASGCRAAVACARCSGALWLRQASVVTPSTRGCGAAVERNWGRVSAGPARCARLRPPNASRARAISGPPRSISLSSSMWGGYTIITSQT